MHSKVLSAGTWWELELGCGASAIHKRAHHVRLDDLCYCFHMCGVKFVAFIVKVWLCHDETPSGHPTILVDDAVWKVIFVMFVTLQVKSTRRDETT
jgi:hypothetical protein